MNDITNAKDSAFPFVINNDEYAQGLTKREYFAAMAMQGICQNPSHIGGYLSAAIEAVKQADALIEQLNK
jgi:hypothetical protein